MTVDATFSFDPWEHYRVMRTVSRGSRSMRLLYGMVLFLMLLLLLPLLLGQSITSRNFWSFGAFAAVVLVGLPLLQLRASFKHRTIHGPPHTFHGLELNADGVRAYCDHTSTDLKWVAIHKARETREFFLVYHARDCACYLPKRALDGEQIAQVRQILTTHLGERAALETQRA